eukprot:GHRQ01021220.1.p1 GENE.GHRQ01021220.1~~GHRQ01021220.1.p1  ORF type:complete len:112 (-),score=3.44 GHRQ01021220.1:121-456(-)
MSASSPPDVLPQCSSCVQQQGSWLNFSWWVATRKADHRRPQEHKLNCITTQMMGQQPTLASAESQERTGDTELACEVQLSFNDPQRQQPMAYQANKVFPGLPVDACHRRHK